MTPEWHVHGDLLLLYLDRCTFYGEDLGDLAHVLQFADCRRDELHDLFTMLVSPALAPAFAALKAEHPQLTVALYTARSTFLNMRAFIPLAEGAKRQRLDDRAQPQWAASLLEEGNHLYIPPSIETAEALFELSREELSLDVMPQPRLRFLRFNTERLFACRVAVQRVLGLDYLPGTVVCSVPKSVARVRARLGVPESAWAVLYDDKEELRGAPDVVTVPHFDRLPVATARKVLEVLTARVPPSQLTPECAAFLYEVKGQPQCCLQGDAPETYAYRVPVCGAEALYPLPWPLPCQEAPEQAPAPFEHFALPAAVEAS